MDCERCTAAPRHWRATLVVGDTVEWVPDIVHERWVAKVTRPLPPTHLCVFCFIPVSFGMAAMFGDPEPFVRKLADRFLTQLVMAQAALN